MAPKRERTKKKETKMALAVIPEPEGDKERRVAFDYEKSKFFRVIHVDGAIGSPTPKGDGIQMALFSERVPIPRSEEYSITTGGQIGERTQIDVRPCQVFREVEVEAILSIEIAKRLRDWLSDKIETVQNIRSRGTPNA